VARPLSSSLDYLAVVDRIHGPQAFLRTFVARLGSYPVHVRGHPPGMPLLFWAIGGTPGVAAAVVLASSAVVAAAVLIACRAVAGERLARRAAPFIVLSPAALWMGTSADAVFAALVAVAIALVVARRAFLGGVMFGGALLFTYGAVPLLLLPAVVARRRAVIAALAIALVLVLAAIGGFWWLDGLRATHAQYSAGIAAHRSYPYFVVLGNPAVVAVAIGPAVVAALAGLRERRLWLLCGAALGALVLADISGLSKAEVERIWLPFFPWLTLAAATLQRPRLWLALNAAVAVALQLALRSAW
jgi:hypothetical protein